MSSEPDPSLRGALRRLHARGLELAEWLALLGIGAVTSGTNGYNLFQFVRHGRFYVMVRHEESYWAYWHGDALAMVAPSLISLGIFVVGAVMLATAFVYPILIMRWGRSAPAYLRKPPLSIQD
jgi:hypothetical protein